MTSGCMYYDHAPFLDGEAVTQIKSVSEVTQLLSDRSPHKQAGAGGAELPGWAERAENVA